MALQDKSLIKLNIENLKDFQASVKAAIKQVGSLKEPMGMIATDFYISERAIFKLKSAGGYADLAESTKAQKKKLGVPVYPILKRSGKLEASITSSNAEGSILRIGDKSVEIGTSIEYGLFHNSDLPRKKIPQRKFVFLGPESREFQGKKEFGGRPIRWANIIQNYVQSVTGAYRVK